MNALSLATNGLITNKGTYKVAQEIKNAFAEVIARLKASEEDTGTGYPGLLSGVMLVEGPTEQTFAQQDLPVIVYEILEGGFTEDAAFPDRARSKFTVLFTIMTDAQYGYYSDEGLGIIDLYEKLMTVLDCDISGNRDLTGAGYWGPITAQYRIGGFERSGLINTYLLEAEFQTIRYGRGTLR
jgi:hypothetical protein